MNASVEIFVSTVSDGTMRLVDAMPRQDELQAIRNRQQFLKKYDIELEQTVGVHLDYASSNFCRYGTVDQRAGGEGITEKGQNVDALATRQKNLALFLPLADCIGAVLYDPCHEVIMLSHLGRHNLEQNGAQKSVEYLVNEFDTRPGDIEVWLSPSAGKENYPLYSFANRSLEEVAIEQMQIAGVKVELIEPTSVDTTTSSEYFSHSRSLKNPQAPAGRFAVLAMMK